MGTSGSLMSFAVRHLYAPVLTVSRLGGHVEQRNGHGLAPSTAPTQRGRQAAVKWLIKKSWVTWDDTGGW